MPLVGPILPTALRSSFFNRKVFSFNNYSVGMLTILIQFIGTTTHIACLYPNHWINLSHNLEFTIIECVSQYRDNNEVSRRKISATMWNSNSTLPEKELIFTLEIRTLEWVIYYPSEKSVKIGEHDYIVLIQVIIIIKHCKDIMIVSLNVYVQLDRWWFKCSQCNCKWLIWEVPWKVLQYSFQARSKQNAFSGSKKKWMRFNHVIGSLFIVGHEQNFVEEQTSDTSTVLYYRTRCHR